ncbi:hypothetical protein [Ensifer adhaerens]|uniref:hypothetical protein n=1 Tax=Ensifer adhaerens TaxID=106592 RepID=UPI003F843379
MPNEPKRGALLIACEKKANDLEKGQGPSAGDQGGDLDKEQAPKRDSRLDPSCIIRGFRIGGQGNGVQLNRGPTVETSTPRPTNEEGAKDRGRCPITSLKKNLWAPSKAVIGIVDRNDDWSISVTVRGTRKCNTKLDSINLSHHLPIKNGIEFFEQSHYKKVDEK